MNKIKKREECKIQMNKTKLLYNRLTLKVTTRYASALNCKYCKYKFREKILVDEFLTYIYSFSDAADTQ